MSTIYLDVPYSEKDKLKKMGARWDPSRKRWFIHDHPSVVDFLPWITELQPPTKFNIFNENYYIARSSKNCWKCGRSINIYGFYLPRGHKYMQDIQCDEVDWGEDTGIYHYDPNIETGWCINPCASGISYINRLNPEPLSEIKKLSPYYKYDYSLQADDNYYANHCPHCKRLQGDFMIYQEPGGAFCPVEDKHARKIDLIHINEPIFISGGTSFTTDDFFEDMKIIPSFF
ncbi:DUF5710 domain-containing protein [Citrobacter braakii]|uniref:DUF5710 domain-containing protein n=1 Tax=Citrobacter braakii TaxID=57706 RepID=UPI0040397A93